MVIFAGVQKKTQNLLYAKYSSKKKLHYNFIC